ncbi:hypothetical protein HMPREF0653_01408 [Prevotella disiens JCM 6334 = ATCC 29426]|uniref:Uncharacterized protein n=1 Tax=Prevotella disiens JCM 6334 = ATCC 29426 TaxID=1235811 RepID=A0ABN0NRW8_9BACT|nr:hypothetical protein HMPREF0653_01408 [Prevotella disiens JCM 6334 = ATCC 29426]
MHSQYILLRFKVKFKTNISTFARVHTSAYCYYFRHNYSYIDAQAYKIQ